MLSLLVVGSYYLRQAYGCTHVQKQGEKEIEKSCTRTDKDESGFYSSRDRGMKALSLTQGAYFGIDLQKWHNALYVRIYPRQHYGCYRF